MYSGQRGQDFFHECALLTAQVFPKSAQPAELASKKKLLRLLTVKYSLQATCGQSYEYGDQESQTPPTPGSWRFEKLSSREHRRIFSLKSTNCSANFWKQARTPIRCSITIYWIIFSFFSHRPSVNFWGVRWLIASLVEKKTYIWATSK